MEKYFVQCVKNKHNNFFKKNNKIVLEAANPKYEPITLDFNQVSIQGKLLAVWRKF